MKYLKRFEELEDKWSVKRYGNGHAVYYDGVIVGFDDKEIGEEEGVNSKLYNVEIIYTQEYSDTMSIYVVDFIDKVFNNTNNAVKEIAQKIAKQISNQSFVIKII